MPMRRGFEVLLIIYVRFRERIFETNGGGSSVDRLAPKLVGIGFERDDRLVWDSGDLLLDLSKLWEAHMPVIIMDDRFSPPTDRRAGEPVNYNMI